MKGCITMDMVAKDFTISNLFYLTVAVILVFNTWAEDKNEGDNFYLSITTQSGDTYEDCTIKEVNSSGIKVYHSKGIVVIPFHDLPRRFQQKYGYNTQVKQQNNPSYQTGTGNLQNNRVFTAPPTIHQQTLPKKENKVSLWALDEKTDPLTDQLKTTAVLKGEPGTLFVRCKGNEMSVIIDFDDFLDIEPVRVQFRFDKGNLIQGLWSPSTEGTALFVPDYGIFAQTIINSTTLIIEAKDFHGTSHRVNFDLTGASSVVPKVFNNCNKISQGQQNMLKSQAYQNRLMNFQNQQRMFNIQQEMGREQLRQRMMQGR